MTKKGYWITIVVIAVIAVAFGFVYYYSYLAKTGTKAPVQSLSQQAQDLSREEDSFSEDVAELLAFDQDDSLNALDQDLLAISEGPFGNTNISQAANGVDISSIESLSNDISNDLDSFSGDISDLDEFENDSSINDIGNSLSEITQ
ncbi:hypothetical protein J7J23_02820 [bacterium]|nr:hypothetical protein [bacterium]